MPRRRPTAVTVMGILNIVFGSLSLLCVTCLGLVFLFMANQSGFGNPVFEIWDAMKREMPAYPAVTTASLILGILMAAMLILAGIGLLNMQGWARVLSILYSIVMVLSQIGLLIFQLAYVLPGIQRVQQNFAAAFGPGPGNSGDQTAGTVWNVLVATVFIVYAILLLIMMLLPGVSAAFSGHAGLGDYDRDGYDRDRYEDGDDYQRRRRRDWGD